jgi:hypothetical protein
MKRLMILLLCVLLVMLSLGAACTSSKTVTVTLIQTRTGIQTNTVPTTITTTITQVFGGQTESSVVVLTGLPPLIPHGTTVNGMYGPCFSCHPIPAGHTGRIANEDLCSQCHKQGPYDPYLLPL